MRSKPTLITARVALTDSKAAVAGVMLEFSFAKFTILMATFNDERAASRRFGGWNMTET